MSSSVTLHDESLRSRLASLSSSDDDYWSFQGNSHRKYGHGLFQYPAMMVPQVTEVILNTICEVHPEIKSVGDPFVGSGTVLTESMMKGLAFWGTDINPLSILLCQVKSGPFFVDALDEKIQELYSNINEDHSDQIEIDFFNIDKWYKREIQVGLSKVKRAIHKESALWARRFFWLGLAEIARYASNSRTSTYKLHTRTADDIANRDFDVSQQYRSVIDKNFSHYKNQATQLKKSGSLNRGYYRNPINIRLADIRNSEDTAEVDLIITSPPYGDNATTVPYGQYSYLPLQWIDLDDIVNGLSSDILITTHEIDTRSLGGSKRIVLEDKETLLSKSPSLCSYLNRLDGLPRDRSNRVLAFFRDLNNSLVPIMNTLKAGGIMVWVLGNRTVGGLKVPLDQVLYELLQGFDATLITKLSRRIVSKKMASKNNVSQTMDNETILIMRKAGLNEYE